MTTPQYLEMSKKVIVKLGWNSHGTYVYSFLWWAKHPLLPALKLTSICLN